MEHCPGFKSFLEQNGLDAKMYLDFPPIPRYIRLNPRLPAVSLEELRAQLGDSVAPVGWMAGFFSVADDVKIAGCEAYRQGALYGLDAASGAAVRALNPKPGEHVLDLCAAPGAKLCMIGDLLQGRGSVTGVDVARPRLATCRTLASKYKVPNCRLFLCDGATFDASPPCGSGEDHAAASGTAAAARREDHVPEARGQEADAGAEGGLRRDPAYTGGGDREGDGGRSSGAEERVHKRRKRIKGAAEEPSDRECFFSTSSSMWEADVHEGEEGAARRLYDCVLVDAECTHDGSIKHILKYDKWGWDTFERRFLDPERIHTITQLQRRLLTNGLRLLRPGGRLVYSTCSLTKAQNEEVVAAVLAAHPGAVEVRPCPPQAESAAWPCAPGGLEHTLRFDPYTSATSGLFIACMHKL